MRAARTLRGFSIIEALIAASMLITGLAGFAMAMSSLTHQQEHQRHRAAAAAVAGNVMEELVLKHDTRTLSAGASTAKYDAKGRADSNGAYTAATSVTNDTPMADGRTIEVLVTWRENGARKEYKLKTYAYLPPP
jgi:Tfp pilus assembly protein PilV